MARAPSLQKCHQRLVIMVKRDERDRDRKRERERLSDTIKEWDHKQQLTEKDRDKAVEVGTRQNVKAVKGN